MQLVLDLIEAYIKCKAQLLSVEQYQQKGARVPLHGRIRPGVGKMPQRNRGKGGHADVRWPEALSFRPEQASGKQLMSGSVKHCLGYRLVI